MCGEEDSTWAILDEFKAAQANAETRQLEDPIVKYDGAGKPVRASELAKFDPTLGRRDRREMAREARRRAKRAR